MDKQLKKINPFEIMGSEIKKEAAELAIDKTEDLQIANSIFSECQKLIKEIEDKRKELVKPHNDEVSQINALAKKVCIPTNEAKIILKEKILEYNEEQERKRLEEERKEREKLERMRLKEETERKAREEKERKIREAEEKKLEAIRKKQELEAKRIKNEQNDIIRKQQELEAKKLKEQAKLEAEKIDIANKKREVEEEKKRLEEEKERIAEEKRQEEARLKREQEEKDDKIKGLRISWKYKVIDENLVPKSFCSPDSKKINEAIKNGVREIEGLEIFREKSIR